MARLKRFMGNTKTGNELRSSFSEQWMPESGVSLDSSWEDDWS